MPMFASTVLENYSSCLCLRSFKSNSFPMPDSFSNAFSRRKIAAGDLPARASPRSARSCSTTAANSAFYIPTSLTRSPITSIRQSGTSRSPTWSSIRSH